MHPVYLCGPINGRSDDDCKNWREKAKSHIGKWLCFDPMIRDYRGKEQTAFREIVEQDKRDIDHCNTILVYYDKPSVGTSMEILYAWQHHKRIFLVNVSDKPLSPWLLYHATHIFTSLDDALNHICPHARTA